jgi:hypothetical protein
VESAREARFSMAPQPASGRQDSVWLLWFRRLLADHPSSAVAGFRSPATAEADAYSATVSGRGKLNTCRLRGTGSSPLVKNDTEPFDSNRKGSGRRWAGRLSGRPAAYLADCASGHSAACLPGPCSLLRPRPPTPILLFPPSAI